MKNTKLNLLLFLVAIFGFTAVNLLMPKTDKVSVLEQRNIQQIPEFSIERLFEGQYTREFDNYFSDNFAFRTPIIKVGTQLKQAKGFEEEATIIVNTGGDNMGADMNATEDEPESAAGTNKTQYLILNDQAFTAFQYTVEAAETFAETLNRFAANVDPAIRVYSMLVPSSVEFVEEKKYKELSDSQKEAFAVINNKLDEAIGQVDTYGSLEQHTDEYIYFRTDHHWTALGAYYGYLAFMNALGEAPIDLDQYESKDQPGFLGTAYKFTLHEKLKNNPDTLTYYMPFTDYKYVLHTKAGRNVESKVVESALADKSAPDYSTFLGGDFAWGEIATEVRNGKTLLIIKDSYGNAFIPFLLPHFESIYYIDPRHFQGNLFDFVKEKAITDVLFLNGSMVARHNGISDLLNEKMDVGR